MPAVLRRGAPAAALLTMLFAPAASARIDAGVVDVLEADGGGAATEPAGLVLEAPSVGPVSSGFGARWGRLHSGIDFGSAGASSPDVVAAADGLVLKTGYLPSWEGYGNVVLLGHADGYRTLYAHLSAVTVEPRQRVAAGEKIGVMGCTGSCYGTHLHFEVHRRAEPLDPARFLR